MLTAKSLRLSDDVQDDSGNDDDVFFEVNVEVLSLVDVFDFSNDKAK